MSYRPIIPQYICWAQADKLGPEGARVCRVLRAHTAADAISQAELLLRTQKVRCPWLAESPELTLVEVEPFAPPEVPLPIRYETWQ